MEVPMIPSVQRPTSNKTKNSNRNQKETEGRLTAAPSRAYYYNILGNLYAKWGHLHNRVD